MYSLATYFAPLIVLAAATTVITVLVRKAPRLGEWVVRAVALVLFLSEASWWVHLAADRGWTPANGFPFQLCDSASVIAAAALWWRRPVLVEITYFWGLAGTLQGLLTPGVAGPYPTFWYFQHYLTHGLVVAAAFILVLGYRVWPRPGSVPRMIAITLAFAAFDALVNAVTGSDYLYLRYPPPLASLLNVMGPWPWYLFTASLLAIALFLLLDLPFRVVRGRELESASV